MRSSILAGVPIEMIVRNENVGTHGFIASLFGQSRAPVYFRSVQ
jgi:hypothetical protein